MLFRIDHPHPPPPDAVGARVTKLFALPGAPVQPVTPREAALYAGLRDLARRAMQPEPLSAAEVLTRASSAILGAGLAMPRTPFPDGEE